MKANAGARRPPSARVARCTGRGEAERPARSRLALGAALTRVRREELCLLTVRDVHARRGVLHLRVQGKRGKLLYLPLHPGTAESIHAYLEAAGHGGQPAAPLFQPTRRFTGEVITPDGVYKVVRAYAAAAKIAVDGLGVDGLRATAATNALDHEADIAKVQE